ncbi:unnamed protein product [Amoebophrya sp. A25]|nr:unnamed protein product [Amoebophrya sp. A25]|eukprot:GSA25T00016681001.1
MPAVAPQPTLVGSGSSSSSSVMPSAQTQGGNSDFDFEESHQKARSAIASLRDVLQAGEKSWSVEPGNEQKFALLAHDVMNNVCQLRQCNLDMRANIESMRKELQQKDPVAAFQRKYTNDLFEEGQFLQQVLHAGVPESDLKVDLIPEEEWTGRQALLEQGMDPTSTLYRLHHLHHELQERTKLENELKEKKDAKARTVEQIQRLKERGSAKLDGVEKVTDAVKKLLQARPAAEQAASLQQTRSTQVNVAVAAVEAAAAAAVPGTGGISGVAGAQPKSASNPALLPEALAMVHKKFSTLAQDGFDTRVSSRVDEYPDRSFIPADGVAASSSAKESVLLRSPRVVVTILASAKSSGDIKPIELHFRAKQSASSNAFATGPGNIEVYASETELRFPETGEDISCPAGGPFHRPAWIARLLKAEITALSIVQAVRAEMAPSVTGSSSLIIADK